MSAPTVFEDIADFEREATALVTLARSVQAPDPKAVQLARLAELRRRYDVWYATAWSRLGRVGRTEQERFRSLYEGQPFLGIRINSIREFFSNALTRNLLRWLPGSTLGRRYVGQVASQFQDPVQEQLLILRAALHAPAPEASPVQTDAQKTAPEAASAPHVSQPDDQAAIDIHYMRMAVEQAKKSVDENDGRPHPRVGAVVVKDGVVLATGHRGEGELGRHAEFTALDLKLKGRSLVGATLYTTLEPCTSRSSKKWPCCQRVLDAKLSRVVIGVLDPNPDILGVGQTKLRAANVNVIVGVEDPNLIAEIESINRDFFREQRRAGATSNAHGSDAPPLARSDSGGLRSERAERQERARQVLRALQGGGSVAAGITECLLLAHEEGDGEFAAFCDGELRGYQNQKPPEHRRVDAFASPEELRMDHVRDMRDAVRQLEELARDKRNSIYKDKYPVQQTIAALEDAVASVDPARAITILRRPAKGIFLGPDVSPEMEAFIYISIFEFQGVIRAVRNRATAWLLDRIGRSETPMAPGSEGCGAELPRAARDVLLAAVGSSRNKGEILVTRTLQARFRLKAGDRDDLFDPREPRQAADFEAALDALTSSGLVVRRSDAVSHVTAAGYKRADELRAEVGERQS